MAQSNNAASLSELNTFANWHPQEENTMLYSFSLFTGNWQLKSIQNWQKQEKAILLWLHICIVIKKDKAILS